MARSASRGVSSSPSPKAKKASARESGSSRPARPGVARLDVTAAVTAIAARAATGLALAGTAREETKSEFVIFDHESNSAVGAFEREIVEADAGEIRDVDDLDLHDFAGGREVDGNRGRQATSADEID